MNEGGVPVVVLDPDATDVQREEILAHVGGLSPGAALVRGDGWLAVAAGDGVRAVDTAPIARLPGVRQVVEVSAPYRLASREVFEVDTAVRTGTRDHGAAADAWIGGRQPIAVMVDCSAPALGDERLRVLLDLLGEAGATIVFAGEVSTVVGLEDPSIVEFKEVERIRRVASDAGLAVCVEISDHRRIGEVSDVADLLQVGSRNMQDFNLLRELGRADRPVLMKRGHGATVEEFILGAEYVLSHGNGRVVLCESGIRTFDAIDRPRFEINAVPVIKRATHLPLMADPASATSQGVLVPAVVKAAVAAGADGVVVQVAEEVPVGGAEAAIDVPGFLRLMDELEPIARAVGRRLRAGRSRTRGDEDGQAD